MRFPAVFTSLADIFLGASLVAVSGREWNALIPHWNVGALLLASAGLYLSGMVFNDVFDVEQDRVERPQRPIPSGRVSRRNAAMIASVLMLAGCLAALTVGTRSLGVAVALAVCVLLYDGVLKSTPIAPVIMGACRSLNILLGASLGASEAGMPYLGFPVEVIYVAIGTGSYILGVTLFARNEAGEPRPAGLLMAMLVIDAAFIGLAAAFLTGAVATELPDRVAAFLLVIVAFVANRRGFAVVRNPKPALVQGTVRLMLMSIIMLDAALIYGITGHVLLAVATAMLVLPALWVGKWLYVT